MASLPGGSSHNAAGASTSGVQPATAIDRMVALGNVQRKEQAVEELCMFFYTSETPFLRVENEHLINLGVCPGPQLRCLGH